jgi:transcriptional regulator with XRE-family HTH domain
MTTPDIKSVVDQIPESRRTLAVNLHMLTTCYCSATELAEGIENHSSEVSRWIRGKNNPGIDTLHKIASFFGIQLHELLNPDLAETLSKGGVVITREQVA